MRVEVGSHLGRVGNSGRSTFAHLHMQLQSAPDPGSPTRPFRLANYLRVLPAHPQAQPWIVSGVPAQGEVVVAAARSQAVYLTLAGITPGTAVWTVESSGDIPRPFRSQGDARVQRVEVSVDGLGRHVFADPEGGALTVCLDPDAWRVVALDGQAGPLLKLLALAVPTIPYAARAGVTWTDLPPWKPEGALRRPLALALAPYLRRPFLRVSSTLAAEPAAQTLSFEVLTRLDPHAAGLPVQVRCTCSPLRGPVRIRADFERGSLTCSLLSYEAAGPRDAAPR
jgi:hypothetical protein